MTTQSPNIRAIQNARVCFYCGTSILNLEEVICPSCHGTDINDRHASPIYTPPEPGRKLPHPWNIELRKGGTCLLAGNRGAGKTTCCMQLEPDYIGTSEQEVVQVKDSWFRILGQSAARPNIAYLSTWDDLAIDLEGITEGTIVVVDSITQLGATHNQEEVVRACVQHIRNAQAYAIFITQHNKDGSMAGPNILQHMVDVVSEILTDRDGQRRLTHHKNRFGDTPTTYFTIEDKGISRPVFQYAYSVEGKAGDYRLALHPDTGAKWNELYKELEAKNVRIPRLGVASCARLSGIYSEGFAEPTDIEARKRFAMDNGVDWITPAEIFDHIATYSSDITETNDSTSF